MSIEQYRAAHDRAFIAGATLPAALLVELRNTNDFLLETGASFDTAIATLQPLLDRVRTALQATA